MELMTRPRESEGRRPNSSEPKEPEKQENHLNIISGKLRKKGRQPKQAEFPTSRAEQHVNPIRFETNRPTAILLEEAREKPQKLSMTAQQYKNNQIKHLKSIVHLSPTIKRKPVKARAWEQTQSMSNLNSGYPLQLRQSSKLNLLQSAEGSWTPRKD
jgi:hypothetical protein